MFNDPAPHLATCFAPDYATARARFLALCAKHGNVPRAYLNPLSGPAGEALAADAAWFGRRDASRVMVMTSATHGVEGFCGAGAQLDWLLCGGPAALPEDTAALLVHAVNPHGFAWLRRVTEEGIDLNRNGLDFAGPLVENPGYAELRHAFVPKSLSGPAYQSAQAALARYRDTNGDAAYREARSKGQHVDPRGIHYGGLQPSWARRTLEAVIADFRLAERAQVAVIDYHTGLGRFGYGEPICGSRPGEPGQARARAWYGDSLTEPMLGNSTSVVIPGLTQHIWAREAGAERITFIALEYGTFPDLEVQKAMLDETWLHAYGEPCWGAGAGWAMQTELRRVFHPATADWEEMVLLRSRQILRQTLAGLAQCGPAQCGPVQCGQSGA